MELWLLVSNQNGGFTQILVTMETVFSLIIAAEMIWFWRRVTMLGRSPNLLERMLLTLGAALTLLNLPLEWFTLAYNIPWIGMIQDLKQIVFITITLLVFWNNFTCEIRKEGKDVETRRRYLMNLTVVLAVVLFGFTLLVFNIYKGILLLQNPFHVFPSEIVTLFGAFVIVCHAFHFFNRQIGGEYVHLGHLCAH